MLSDWLKVKLMATDEHCEIQSVVESLSGRHAAGTAFVLAREGTDSYCDKYLSAVRFLMCFMLKGDIGLLSAGLPLTRLELVILFVPLRPSPV